MQSIKLGLIGIGLSILGVVGAYYTFENINPAQALEQNRVTQALESYLSQHQAPNAFAEAREQIQSDPASPSFGSPTARVTLIQFFDYRCPYCKRMARGIDSLMSEDADLRVVFKEFPILAPDSVDSAKAALAAHRQAKYLPFHRLLMAHNGAFTMEAIDEMAKEAELDLDQLHKDMEDPAILQQLRDNHRLAQRLKIEGTPAFILGDKLIPGAVPIEELREAIRQFSLQGGG